MGSSSLVLLVGALVAGTAAASVRPVSGAALLAIDRKAVNRNFLPTRMLHGYSFDSWSYRNGVLRLEFRNPAGSTIDWTVAPMAGNCDVGKQGSFQLAGNKVWFAQAGGTQRAWRCVFGMEGRALRLTASSRTSPSKLAGVGLGTVAASAKRY